ncbi:MAG: ribosomal protein S18-alanine N-acetyltransferase [Gammaproteobacteria bacterium]|nr:MAG: ribosomal protein S18-alanine N-acetyltransferase [Gammaproteobacteria bacterium]
MQAGFADKQHPLIRRLTLADVDRIYAIEQVAYPFPWSRKVFVDCLRVGYACFGLQFGKELAGYTIFSWAAGEAHLLNLCVHPDWQQRGYGSLLLEYAINHVARLESEAIFLEVRESNPRAVDLYKNRGFKVTGHRRSYYQAGDKREDAVVMRLELRHGR